MSKTITSTRSDDTGSIKYDIIDYLTDDPSTQALDPPISKRECKSDRGFNHPVIACLICPQRYLATYDANEDG
jgi:hypothetical protein